MSTGILVGASALCRREFWLRRLPCVDENFGCGVFPVDENLGRGVCPVPTRILVGALGLRRREFGWGVRPASTRIWLGR